MVSTFRSGRKSLPAEILAFAPKGTEWAILGAGRGRYRFKRYANFDPEPNPNLAETKIPDATPGIIAMYALSDEQALLAKLRYNRLIDVFSGVTCYSLQNHLRTSVRTVGQVDTDEVYVGVDRQGAQYVFPVQAKGGRERLRQVQIRQDFALCIEKFLNLICRAIGAQFIGRDLIALFELEESEERIVIVSERHYRLVSPSDISSQELEGYRLRPRAS